MPKDKSKSDFSQNALRIVEISTGSKLSSIKKSSLKKEDSKKKQPVSKR